MQAAQTIGIDLPLKAWSGRMSGQTWLSYNDPSWLPRGTALTARRTPIANLSAACVDGEADSRTA